MFWLLMRVRVKTARNVVREMWRRNPTGAVALSIGSITLFGAMFLGFLLFFRFAERLGVLSETVYQMFYFLFLFLLAGAVPFVAATLLQSADYSLLFAAPVPPRAVVASKLLDATLTNSLQFTILGVPALVACAFALHFGLAGWLLLPVVLALFVLLPALITAFGLLLALWLLGMNRLRGAVTLINVLMAVVVCLTFVLEARHLPVKLANMGQSLTAFQPAISVSPASHASPSHYFATMMLALSPATHSRVSSLATPLTILLSVVGALFAASMLLGGKLLSAASVAEEGAGGGSVRADTPDKTSRLWHKLFTPPVAALIVKDFKYVLRDTMLLSQLAVPLILYFVPFLLGIQDRSLEGRTELFPFSAAIIGIIVFMQTSILSLSLLGMESQSFWVVLVSPNTRRKMLWAKFLLSTVITGGVAAVLTAVASLAFHATFTLFVIELSLAVVCAAGLCGLGVGISALFPRFVHENPSLRVSAWALILGFFATVAYVFASGAIVGLSAWIASNVESVNATRLWYGAGGTLFAAFTLATIVTAMLLGARRIETYEWEH